MELGVGLRCKLLVQPVLFFEPGPFPGLPGPPWAKTRPKPGAGFMTLSSIRSAQILRSVYNKLTNKIGQKPDPGARETVAKGGLGGPGAREILAKGGAFAPPPFGKVSRDPGAAQT